MKKNKLPAVELPRDWEGVDDWNALFAADDAQSLLYALADGLDLEDPGFCPNHNPPLREAIEHGALECAKLLLDAGSDPKARWWGGQSAMHVACASVKPNAALIVSHLLMRGCSPSKPDEEGRAPLHWAAMGLADSVRALIAAGAPVDPESRFFDGQTPLAFACRAGSALCAEALADAGANLAHRSSKGADALSEAFEAAFEGKAEPLLFLVSRIGLPTLLDWTWIRSPKKSSQEPGCGPKGLRDAVSELTLAQPKLAADLSARIAQAEKSAIAGCAAGPQTQKSLPRI